MKAEAHMQESEQIETAIHLEATTPETHPRRIHSKTLSWHDEVSGDHLTVEVQGSESFLAGLAPLGFVAVGEGSHSSNNQRPVRRVSDRAETPAPKGSPSRKEGEPGEHRVRWTVRLARHWNPTGR